jgi:CRISPR system Cascade subunit CasC
LRISSQSLKRAVRTAQIFWDALESEPGMSEGVLGTRTRSAIDRIVQTIMSKAADKQMTKDAALAAVKGALAKKGNDQSEEQDDGDNSNGKKTKKKSSKGDKLIFGTLNSEKGKETETKEIIHFSPSELKLLDDLALQIAEGRSPEKKAADYMLKRPACVDIALFGRMLADTPEYNVEAAAQIAHAFTTHRADVEDDYFTAVDDLNQRGAAHVSVGEFGSGVFYVYACINASLLIHNFGDGNESALELSKKTAAALIETLARTSPSGKQNSYASRAHALYGLVEAGPQQPRSLAAAFLKPVDAAREGEGDLLKASVSRLQALREAFERAYGKPAEAHKIMNVLEETGSLADLVKLAADAAHNAEPLRKRRHAA